MRAIIFVLVLALIMPAMANTKPVQLSGANASTAFSYMYKPTLADNITNFMQTAATQQPGISNVRVNVDANHIGITLQRSITGDDAAMYNALSTIITDYARIVNNTSYRGMLRIGLIAKNFKAIDAIWEISASDVLANSKTPGWLNSKVTTFTGINFYWKDQYGDITKSVDTPGGRMSPMVGNWLTN